jgi:hypothetical protein
MEYLIAEDLEKPVEPLPLMLPFLPHQLLAQIVAQEPAALCEFKRQFFRLGNAFQRGGEESPQQVRDRLDAILARPFGLAFEIVLKGMRSRPLTLASVGQQDVVRQRHIALQLIRLANLIEVFADGLVLYIPAFLTLKSGPEPSTFFASWMTWMPGPAASAALFKRISSALRSECSVLSSRSSLRRSKYFWKASFMVRDQVRDSRAGEKPQG